MKLLTTSSYLTEVIRDAAIASATFHAPASSFSNASSAEASRTASLIRPSPRGDTQGTHPPMLRIFRLYIFGRVPAHARQTGQRFAGCSPLASLRRAAKRPRPGQEIGTMTCRERGGH